MPLQLILGSSGSGKSYTLYTRLIRESLARPNGRFLVIVPEQFTMETQKELVRLHPQKGILNIDVLSFQRLAYRVFEELGEDRLTVLEDTGKSLLLRKVAGEQKEKLKLLGGQLNRPGYIDQVKSLISELTQYAVTAEDMERLLETAKGHGQLYAKLQDIRVLFEAFNQYKKEKFITAEEVLDVLSRRLGDSELLKDAVVAFDGFTGFTPIQCRVLSELLPRASEVLVTVTLDGREARPGKVAEHELFALSKRTVEKLIGLAKEKHVPLRDPVVLGGKPGRPAPSRFTPGGELEFLERNLFRSSKDAIEKKNDGKAGEISLHASRNPVEELHFAARTIIKLVQEEGIRFREIGIIAGDLQAYAPYAEQIFSRYGIPCFLDQTRSVMNNPSLELIIGALNVLEENYTTDSMLRCLRTELAGISREDTDRLENYALALGIRGKKRWMESWTRKTRSMAEGEAAYCDGLRAAWMEKFAPFAQGMKEAGTVREYAEALYRFLTDCGLQEQLAAREERFAAEGRLDKVREYRQVYPIIIDILDKLVSLLGEEKVSRREFSELLQAGFAQGKVGIIPPGVDQVAMGDMERTRLQNVRVLFFLGLNDGWVPKSGGRGSLVSELEREMLKDSGVELAPTDRENSYIQRFYLYVNLTKPSRRLYLSCSKSAMDGSAMRASYLIERIRGLFPEKTVQDEDIPEASLERAAVKAIALEPLAAGMQEWKAGGLREQETAEVQERETAGQQERETARLQGQDQAGQQERETAGLQGQDQAGLREQDRAEEQEQKAASAAELLALYRVLAEDPAYGGHVAALADAVFYVPERLRLKPQAAERLYGRILENSVSRLERFAACAFAHFASYGLGLKERETSEFRGADLGTMLHDALERFSRELGGSKWDWHTLPDEERRRMASACTEAAVREYGGLRLEESARNGYLLIRLERLMQRTVWALQLQVKAGAYRPLAFEIPFFSLDRLDSVEHDLGGRGIMRLQGRIDRLDVLEDGDRRYIKVVDYKSGNTRFSLEQLYYGLQLQLMVYLDAAMEQEQRLHPDRQVLPGGALYYHIQNPLLKADGLDEEERENALLAELMPDGLLNGEEVNIRGMDKHFTQKSTVIPVGRKKDGSYTSASAVTGERQLVELLAYVREKIRSLGIRLLEGDIEAAPYQWKQFTACDYCPYRQVCGFDRRLPGCHFRKLPPISDEEFWNRIVRKKEDTEKEEGPWK